MQIQISNPLDFLQAQAPNVTGLGIGISQIINAVLWILIIGTAVFVFVKFSSHRIFVEILARVKGGYVCQGGRYAKAHDKKNNLEYLRPMFGRDRLPSFPSQAFQKSKGLPFIGIKRELSLIKLNKYSYKVSLPTNDTAEVGESRYYDTLNWVFLEQRRKFLKKMKSEQFQHFLAIAAPLFVILIGFGLVAWALYLGVRADTQNAQFLAQMLDVARAGGG